ncbi:MAG: macro domain-containing protein [Phycisphaeraceae bacterium]|nr:macro domain-containing protein [Phycisphaeraceae bacterium]
MIEPGKDNLLEANVEALVNTVNTVGVMGKGIALQFKKAFPENFEVYARACEAGEVQPGKMLTVDLNRLTNPRFIINFPTKRDWKHKARLKDIEAGLPALIEEVRRLQITSIAVPPLGCGNGGLDWREVRPLIETAFAEVPEVRVLLFAPKGAPEATAMPINTQRPNMTPGRAAVVAVMSRYAVVGYSLTLLEVQKLLYFLQEAGEDLKMPFAKAAYGPYADTLRHVLDKMDGHFIRGWGDGANKPETPLEVVPEAVDEAEAFLGAQSATHQRLERVAELIEGFETPYGMELLSSVHWVAQHEDLAARTDAAKAAAAVSAWNERKRQMFQAEHVELAWGRLKERGWI